PVLLPAVAPIPPDPTPAVLAAGAALAEANRRHGDEFFARLLAAVDARVLNGNSYRRDWISTLAQQLGAWCQGGDFAAPLDDRLARLTAEALQGKANKGKDAQVPASPLCALIPPYIDALRRKQDYVLARRAQLLHRLRDDAHARLATLKQQRRLQTYDDLIDGVADALDGPVGDALATRWRAQYRVALVDEFQDTDARQWAIFRRVFGDQADDPALFLIGDPKQAIYGFRGGDVHTYLAAADIAEAAPALSRNFRSRPAVLGAIDALYSAARGAFDAGRVDTPPFVDARIDFRRVDAGGRRRDDDFIRDG